MKISSNDCKQYILDWYANNPNALPYFSFVDHIDEKGRYYGLKSGHLLSSWKRQAIAKSNGKTYRTFRPDICVVDGNVRILIIEENNQLVSLTVGTVGDFDQYVGKE